MMRSSRAIKSQPGIRSGTSSLHRVPMHQKLPQAVVPIFLVQTVFQRSSTRYLCADDPDFTIEGRIATRGEE